MNSIVTNIRKELIRNADEKTRIQGEKFFRENVKIYGLRSAELTAISNDHYRMLPDKIKPVVFSLCEELWRSGYLEEAGISCMWSYNVRKQYVMKKKSTMPRTALRYAIEKMPRELKTKAMAR